MHKNIIMAILNLQNQSTYLDVSKSAYIAMVRQVFKTQTGLFELYGPVTIEDLLRKIQENKKNVINDLNYFIESIEFLVNELNKKEEGDA